MKAKSQKAPAHLSDSTRDWWRSVVREYQLEPHHMRLLQAAAECWDRLQQARELLQRDGLVIEGREGGMRTSMTRGDTGAGACEILLAESARVLGP